MEQIIGLLLAVFMGLVLGLLGGGGSILAVPLFVYFFNVPPVLATLYSLFVVGIASFLTAIRYRQRINFVDGFFFALPASIAVFLSRKYLLLPMPDTFSLLGVLVNKDDFLMLCLAMVILLISYFMLKARDDNRVRFAEFSRWVSVLIISIVGFLIGAVTGFVGVGGGFVIVPALTLLLKMPIKDAIATSLLIIFFKSFVGFMGDMAAGVDIDWALLFKVVVVALLGSFVGVKYNAVVSASNLRKYFAYFVLFVGMLIIIIR